MRAGKTVVLGEAPESDGEESSVNENEEVGRLGTTSTELATGHEDQRRNTGTNDTSNMRSIPMHSFLASSTIAKLINYSQYSLLQTTQNHPSHKASSSSSEESSLPPLHKSLLSKNQQLYACVSHAKRLPYMKASKDIDTIIQKLVEIQKNIQDINSELIKTKRELVNLDVEINLIV